MFFMRNVPKSSKKEVRRNANSIFVLVIIKLLPLIKLKEKD